MDVLIADDDASLAELYKVMLTLKGLECSAVGSLQELRAVLTHERPRALVIDILLERDSGLEAIAMINELQPRPRLVAVSGLPGDDIRDKIKRAGFDVFLRKPIDSDALYEAVKGGDPSR